MILRPVLRANPVAIACRFGCTGKAAAAGRDGRADYLMIADVAAELC